VVEIDKSISFAYYHYDYHSVINLSQHGRGNQGIFDI